MAELTDADEHILDYCQKEVPYKIIPQLLAKYHNVEISYNAVKKRAKKLGINKRGPGTTSEAEVIAALQDELTSASSLVGYREMTSILRKKGLIVRRNTVMQLLRTLDPEGVEIRRRRRLKRKVYISPGPNYAWHVDGNDKLKPFGFAVHGAIDGYSRMILWLNVAPSNKDPAIISYFYMQTVAALHGCPSLLQTDPGVENGIIAALQCTFRVNHEDELAGSKSHKYGKSTTNQRIESWWSYYRRNRIDWWMDKFYELVRNQQFNKDNDTHVKCIRFCYMSLIQQELDDIKERWNGHNILPSPNARCPNGRPNVLFHLPENTGAEDHLKPISPEAIRFGFTNTVQQTISGCPAFDDYASNIFRAKGWAEPADFQEALHFYTELRRLATNELLDI
ncbi:uncharacterized protein LOC106159197 [Lingula anatina]|uniref:Uncharacterized protein LOC106159197 n=1 Tax=Lingula anatina TaxID=7574 RepID=A0A1S3HXW3_LINAN|nr:uncharacterized protein LOC106159197 [Lingula anatina]|eukprot:XP_013390872.1 uncharacterized protein LOC106159197 [Lingula anatina]